MCRVGTAGYGGQKKAPLEGMSGAKWSSPKQRPSEKRPGRRTAAISETGTREEERSGRLVEVDYGGQGSVGQTPIRKGGYALGEGIAAHRRGEWWG